MSNSVFHKKLLNHYSIVPEQEGVYKVQVAGCSRQLFDEGLSTSRYLVHLRAGFLKNLKEAVQRLGNNESCSYNEVRDCFLIGAIWENKIDDLELLPAKGEYVLATIENKNRELICTNITLLPRQSLETFNYLEHCELAAEYERLIKKYA